MIKTALAILIFSSHFGAHAQSKIFTFKNTEGFANCLNTRNIAESSKNATLTTTVFLSPGEIQARCLSRAEDLSDKDPKNTDLMKSFIKTIVHNSAPENALSLIENLVNANIEECNSIANYEILIAALSHPQDYPSIQNSYYEKLIPILRKCVQNGTFKSDLLEEKENTNSYVKKNVQAFFKNLK